jgi:hypothetical protein
MIALFANVLQATVHVCAIARQAENAPLLLR